mmetsp:Transcript_11276/g.13300  ORF Transcript_11276/g.13300 Transcript_11276/m.13300 type:complete len:83 (-) Transcript_11276:128-376(-)
MGKHMNDIWVNFFEVFNENSSRQREIFFSCPLVQFLWSSFRNSSCYKLQELLDNEKLQGRKQLFLDDIIKMQAKTGCQILPF